MGLSIYIFWQGAYHDGNIIRWLELEISFLGVGGGGGGGGGIRNQLRAG